jgi:hypothetical protein
MKKKGTVSRFIRYFRACIASAAFCLVILTSSCSNGSDGPSPYDPGSETQAATILRNLSVKEVDDPPELITKSTIGTDVSIVDPGEWQPLKKPYSVFGPSAEVFQFGLWSGVMHHAKYEDGKNSPSYDASYPLSGDPDQSWEQGTHKVSTAADLDGDGLDEIAVFYILNDTLYLRVYNDGSFSNARAVNAVDLSDNASSGAASSFDYLQAGSGDFDGDGNDELVLVDYDYAYLLEANSAGATALFEKSDEFPWPIRSVATGDSDGDNADEIAVCLANGQFGYFDSRFSDAITNPTLADMGTGAADATFGDFDGDNLDELAIAYDGAVHYYEDIKKSSSFTEIDWDHGISNYTAMGNPILSLSGLPCMRALDFDGNGLDDVYIYGAVYLNPSKGTPAPNIIQTLAVRQAQVGDVDGDGKEDIILLDNICYLIAGSGLDMTLSIYCDLVAFGQTYTGDVVGKKSYQTSEVVSQTIDASIWLETLETYRTNPSLFSGLVAIAAGNVDKDSPRVRYAGHKLQFTDPAIIAVLASPPYWSSVAAADQAYGNAYSNWETAFGTVTTSSSSAGVSAGFSVGVCVEMEQSVSIFGIELASFKASTSFKQSVNYAVATSYTVSKSVTYKALGGEDKVIFTSVPMDIYSYEVVDSPTASEKGTILKLEIPRAFTTYMVTRSFFNANNGIVADIDGSVLQHTIGDPKSYPTLAQRNSLLAKYGGYASNAALPVSQGSDNTPSGTTVLEISVESGTEESIDLTTEIEMQAGGGAGGVTVLATAGFSAGFNYTTSTSVGTTFGGTVGYLPTAFYSQAAYPYESGLFTYPFFDNRDNRSYWIVNYWRE